MTPQKYIYIFFNLHFLSSLILFLEYDNGMVSEPLTYLFYIHK